MRQLLLVNAQQGHQALLALWPELKNALLAGHRLVLTIARESKSREQERLYHALIAEIAEQAQHLGSTWDAESWKRLLLDKFARDTNRAGGRVVPNLDGNGIVEVGLLSRKFDVETASQFCDWLYAWGAQNGVDFADQ